MEVQRKLAKLYQGTRINALNEITRSISNNQLDYILIDETMKDQYFVTSYNNFVSDHKAIVARIGLNESNLRDEIKEKLFFDQESHMKSKRTPEEDIKETTDEESIPSQAKKKKQNISTSGNVFTRRFENPDRATCWLNSCLQLVLTALDYDEFSQLAFSSELGRELISMKLNSKTNLLDPTNCKDIVVTAEDVRIATRLSELSYQILDKNKLEEQSDRIKLLRMDLRNGQQCVRDFFLCLNGNLVNWPDVYSQFSFTLINSTVCSCNHRNSYETNQLYVEIPVPPNGSSLKMYLEEFFNEGSAVLRECRDGCNAVSRKIQRTELHNSEEAKFLIVILTRGVQTLDGYKLINNKIDSTDIVNIR